MFPYRVKYNESEYDIQDINLLYKIHPKHQNALEDLEKFGTFRKTNFKFLFCLFV